MRKIIVIISIIVVYILGAETVFAGFGITPPYVKNQRLTRGSEFTQQIILVRGDPVEDLKAEITLNIPGASGWFSIDRGMEFVLPKGESQFPIVVTVRVPEDAEYADYTGSIRIRTSSLEKQSGVSIALGAQVDVAIKVVDKIYDFEVTRVELKEAEEGYKKWWLDYPGKITFQMQVQNTGNAPVAPSNITFDIYDKRGEQKLESVKNIGEVATVEAFKTERVEAYLPTHLKPSGYKVKFVIFKETEVARSGDLNLSILPRGVIPGYKPFGFEGLSLGDKLSLIIPGIMIALLFLGFIIWIIVSGGRRRARGGRPRQTSQRSSQQPAEPIRSSAVRRTPVVTPRHPSQGNVIDLSRRR